MGSSAAGRPTTPIRTSFRAGGAIGASGIGGGGINGCATASAPPETHVRTIASVSASPLADMPFLYVEPVVHATRFEINGTESRYRTCSMKERNANGALSSVEGARE